MRPRRSVVITPDRMDSTIPSGSARRSASDLVAAASWTSDRVGRSGRLAADSPTTRNDTSERPAAWIAFAKDSPGTWAGNGPSPLIATITQALNAATLPTEVIIAPRGPTNRLATEIMTIYRAA